MILERYCKLGNLSRRFFYLEGCVVYCDSRGEVCLSVWQLLLNRQTHGRFFCKVDDTCNDLIGGFVWLRGGHLWRYDWWRSVEKGHF